ncbi:hypothetical protein CWS02_15185 [Enterobacter sp. EA-1]|nr:hypothetical protein CWS02_15185 [Enterobacter sp. EA-1]
MSSKLFTPLKVGAITAPNRVLMAPLTRLRSIEPGDIPTPLMAEYYRQRASSGLIISEATQISAQAKAMPAHRVCIAQSKSLRGKNHGRRAGDNGRIAVQLWHTGRISHTSLQLADKRQLHHRPSAPGRALRCAMPTATPHVKIRRCRAHWKPVKSRGSLTTSVRLWPTPVKPVLTL